MDVACAIDMLEEEKYFSYENDPIQAGEILPKKQSVLKKIKGFISHSSKTKSYSKSRGKGDALATTSQDEPQLGCSDMDVTVKEPQDNNLLPMNNSLQENNVSSNITNTSERETDLSTQPEVCPGQIFKKKRSFWKRIKGKRSHSKVIKQGESEDTCVTTGDIEPQPSCSHKNHDRWAAHRKYTTSETFRSNEICTKQESDDKSLSPTDEPRSYSWNMNELDEVLSIISFYSCSDSYSKVVTNGSENDPKSKDDSDREDIQNKQSESDDEPLAGCSWMNLDGWAEGPKTNAESKADPYKKQGESEDTYTKNAFLKAENEFLKEQVKDLKEFIENEDKRNAVLQAEIKALKEQAPLKNLDTKEPRENDLLLMTLQKNENSRERENDLPTQEGKILPHKTWTHGPKSKFKSKNGSRRKGIEKKKYDTDKKLATGSDDSWSVKDVTVGEPQDSNLLPMNNSLQEGPEVCPGQILEKKRSVLKKIEGFFTHGFKKKSKSTQESHIKTLNLVGWTTYRICGIEVYLPDSY